MSLNLDSIPMNDVHSYNEHKSIMSSPIRTDLADLRLFLMIVRRQSFSSAAIEMGITASAASHAIRRLEAKLGTRLLHRTSRAIMPTEVGRELAESLAGGFETIDAALQSVQAPGAASFGTLRINAFADAAHLLLAPALPEFVRAFPDARVCLVVEDRPIDIVSEGYDAGIRYGHTVPEDMVAVALTGPQRWVVVAAPSYLRLRGEPKNPAELGEHTCLQLLLGDNSNYRWELWEAGAETAWRVPGNITIKDTATTILAAKSGIGLAYLLESRVRQELAEGSLHVVLEPFAAPGEAFHIYYGSRRHNHPALRALTNIIRGQNGLTRI